MKSKTPVSVMWESTIACGLRCKHCKASARTRPDPDELTTEEGFALIDQVASYGAPYPVLRITGGNALLREDIFELIAYGKEKGLTVTIAPSTTPDLNQENIQRLKDSGCDTVAVSIDGPDAGTHDAFRGVPGTFDRLVEACSLMREADLPFRLLTTVTRFNAEHLPEIMARARELGAAGWYLYMLIPTGRARQDYGLSPGEFEDVFHFIYDLMARAPMTVNAIAGSEPYRRVAVMRRLVEMGRLDPSLLQQGPLYARLKGKLDRIIGDAPRGGEIRLPPEGQEALRQGHLRLQQRGRLPLELPAHPAGQRPRGFPPGGLCRCRRPGGDARRLEAQGPLRRLRVQPHLPGLPLPGLCRHRRLPGRGPLLRLPARDGPEGGAGGCRGHPGRDTPHQLL
ncbi:MAG: radical SAM protein [Euryarchaeota archaeon]|nr:radical SAM protein [Euryarchaeota archaeon]